MDGIRPRLGSRLAPHLPASLHGSQVETTSGLVHTRAGSLSTWTIRIGNAEMSQVLSAPIRQGTGRCVLFGGNFAVLQFLCNPDAFWSVVSYSCSADSPFSVVRCEYPISQWDQMGHSPS